MSKHFRPPPAEAPFAWLRTLSDADLDRHIDHLHSWLDFETEDMTAALDERDRRGDLTLELTVEGEAWLKAHEWPVAS